MMTARDIMHNNAECVDANESLSEAAQRMRDDHVGALPICGNDNRLHGIITDRDIVVKCIAGGHDPNTVTAGQLADDRLIWVEAETEIHDCLQMMEDNSVRRVPVLDNRKLVGMISEADIAQHLSEDEVAEFVERVYAAPPNN
ncbi:CBS domain-containing protein [Haloglycomyces albus]|uniref:CBS domain-containing protein n=1 Tax=Haloglycomyces albus TaxID=526067 RepID=UPI00046CD844|nr:CBS domain-containing protein [Haloglycomyces albus]